MANTMENMVSHSGVAWWTHW